MKLIIAIIRPEDLDAVQAAVEETEASVISVSEVRYGRGRSTGFYRGAEYRAMRLRLRLEIVMVNELLVPDAIEAIGRAISGPDSGNSGEGEVLVTELDEVVRFSPRQMGSREASYSNTNSARLQKPGESGQRPD